jgi:hypothetical protein
MESCKSWASTDTISSISLYASRKVPVTYLTWPALTTTVNVRLWLSPNPQPKPFNVSPPHGLATTFPSAHGRPLASRRLSFNIPD